MRNAFVQALEEAAEEDSRIVVLTADMGFSVFESFRKRFPGRFYNMGISEQNMIGVAAGLSLMGKKVYVYSIIPFVTFRCLEQIRNDLCYHDLDVVVVGVGSGFSYGAQGFTHHATEDIGVLKPIANITILTPSDPGEVGQLVRESSSYRHPAYLRLGKSMEKIYDCPDPATIGKARLLRKGSEVALITCGNILEEVMRAYDMLRKDGLNPSVVTVPTIKPLDEPFFRELFRTHRHIVIVEEHSRVGGLGESLFSMNRENPAGNLFIHLAVDDRPVCEVGSDRYIRRKLGLDGASIRAKVKEALGRKRF